MAINVWDSIMIISADITDDLAADESEASKMRQ